MDDLHLKMPQEQIEAYCRKWQIKELSFFGSVLRKDFKPDSDIDILVEFDPDHIPGLIRLAGMENELSDLIGRKVDLRTAQDLSPYFRQAVLATAEVQYVEG
jgi:predicted nucleotidyltransferase